MREFVSSILSLQSVSLGLGHAGGDDTLEVLFSADRCHRLQNLTLYGSNFRKSTLIALLAQCEGTLRSLKLFSVRLEDADAWLQLLSELPTTLTSLQYLSITRLANGPTVSRSKNTVFPRLTGYLALPGSENMGFELSRARLGRPWQPSDVVGVTYSGQEMGKALDYIFRAGAVYEGRAD